MRKVIFSVNGNRGVLESHGYLNPFLPSVPYMARLSKFFISILVGISILEGIILKIPMSRRESRL